MHLRSGAGCRSRDRAKDRRRKGWRTTGLVLRGVAVGSGKEGTRQERSGIQPAGVDARRLKASHSLQVPDDGDTYERFEI